MDGIGAAEFVWSPGTRSRGRIPVLVVLVTASLSPTRPRAPFHGNEYLAAEFSRSSDIKRRLVEMA